MDENIPSRGRAVFRKSLFFIAGVFIVLLALNEGFVSFHKTVVKGAFTSIREYLAYANVTLAHKEIIAPRSLFPVNSSTRIHGVDLYVGNGATNLSSNIPYLDVETGMFSDKIVIKMPQHIAVSLVNRQDELIQSNLPSFAIRLIADKEKSACILQLKGGAFQMIWRSWMKWLDDVTILFDKAKINTADETILEGEKILLRLSDISMRRIAGLKSKVAGNFEIERDFVEGDVNFQITNFTAVRPEFFGEYAKYISDMGIANLQLNLHRFFSEKYDNSTAYNIMNGSYLSSDLFSIKGGGEVYFPLKWNDDRNVNYLNASTHVKNYPSLIDIGADTIKRSLVRGSTAESAELIRNMPKNVRLLKFASRYVLANGDASDADLRFTVQDPASDIKINGYDISQLLDKMDLSLESMKESEKGMK